MMLGYYLQLGFRHLRRNPVLTGLIVVTIAVGVAASMATLTILHAMSGDPIPHRSSQLFVPLVDIRPSNNGDPDPEPPALLSYRDTLNLRAAHKAARQTAIYGIAPAIDVGRPNVPPWFADGVAVDRDFFAMFDVPFVRGGAWSTDDDAKGAQVVVLREDTAAKLFGTADPVGKTVPLGDKDYVVAGVVADSWHPVPKFYRLVGSAAVGDYEELFIPFQTGITNEVGANGQLSCYDNSRTGAGWKGLIESNCVWVMYWAELDTSAEVASYRDYLSGYAAEQHTVGRFERQNTRLYGLMQWLDARKVVADDAKLQTYLAFGFLLVCLVNTIGLLLAKFTARAGEIGVRRALGASRRQVFVQYLTETAVLGVAGGIVGLGLAQLALWMMSARGKALKILASMDWPMFATTFALALGATLVAGLLPTWRACQVRPAVQLKSQ